MELEQILLNAAHLGGAIAKDRAFGHTISWKHTDDPVTEADKEAENAIKRVFREQMNPNFVGEEHGEENTGSEYTVYIDAIDGTKSYVRGDFLSAVSIGVERNGKLIAGCVYDCMRDICYIACGDDAKLVHADKEQPFRHRAPFKKLNIHIDERGETFHSRLSNLPHGTITDRGGSIALNLAQLAAGNYDAMIYNKPGKGNSWDTAGAAAIANASGIELYDADGEPYDINNPKNGIIAVRPECREYLLPLIFPGKKNSHPRLEHVQ